MPDRNSATKLFTKMRRDEKVDTKQKSMHFIECNCKSQNCYRKKNDTNQEVKKWRMMTR